MAVLADRVRETSTTTGTGTLTLAGALPSYQSFNATFTNGALVYYVIQSATDYEIGVGTVGTGTLARTTVLRSSNAGALVSFAAGPKDVFVSYVADRAVTTVDAATLTNKTIDDYTNFIGANQLHIKVKATATLALGTVCKAVGWNASENAVEVAAVSSAADIALGVTDAVISIGDLGEIINTGYLEGINTNAFAPGTILYPNTSGGFTATKPSSGTFQAVAYVLRQNVSNGTVFVEFTNPQAVESSTNTANTLVLRDGSGNFAAGTVTAALTGNASTATALATARNINGVAFNGTADITVTAAAGTLSGSTLNSGVTASSLTSVGTLSTLQVSGNATFDTNTLFVDAVNNRVGVGTASPIGPLDIRGASTDIGIRYIEATTGSNNRIQFGAVSGAGYIDATASVGSPALQFRTAGNTHAVIDSTGNLAVDTNTLYVDATNNRVGVGTAAPTNALDVAGSARVRSELILDGVTKRYRIYSSSSDELFFARDTSAGVFEAVPLRIDSSGNLGLDVTPSAWGAGTKAIQVRAGTALYNPGSAVQSWLMTNSYNNGTNFIYTNTGAAGYYAQNGGIHAWHSAPSGTAGAAISFTQAMTLDASGRLGIGTVSPTSSLHIGNGTGLQQAYINGAGYDVTVGASGGAMFGFASSTISLVFNTTATPLGIGTNAAQPLILGTNQTERVRIDSAGNLGLGVTPSAWGSTGRRAIDITALASIAQTSAGSATISFNSYQDASNNWIYKTTNAAARYDNGFGGAAAHAWFTAPSGTAGAAITFTQAMTLSSSGNLTIGGTNESARVRIEGTTNLSTALQVFRSGNSCGAIWQEASAMRFGTDGSTGFTEKLRVDATTTAGQTALLLWDVDNGTMERVTVGAADSGGTGFKVLRIPN